MKNKYHARNKKKYLGKFTRYFLIKLFVNFVRTTKNKKSQPYGQRILSKMPTVIQQPSLFPSRVNFFNRNICIFLIDKLIIPVVEKKNQNLHEFLKRC